MAQTISIAGASYPDVPSISVPKTGGGTAQFYDTTIASNAAAASDIASGKLAYVNGSLITGTGSGGGGGGGYTLTTVVPQQTFTPNSSKQALLTFSAPLVDADFYLVTYDNVQWVSTCETFWGGDDIIIGDLNLFFSATDTMYPFAVDYGSNTMTVVAKNTSQHTIKVERFEFVDEPIPTPTLITKSITANGTYNASSDNADGYSSVTVNVSGGASNFVTGTFKGTTTNAAMDVTLNYSGSGYPVSFDIYPTEGAYKSGGTFYQLVQRYATEIFTGVKCDMSSTPSYIGGASNANSMILGNRYKNSSSNATTYTSSWSEATDAMGGANASAGQRSIVKFKAKNKMSVFIANTSYGFAANIEYTYRVIYSS